MPNRLFILELLLGLQVELPSHAKESLFSGAWVLIVADHNTDEPYYGMGDLTGDSSIFVMPEGLTDSGGAGWANPNTRDVGFADDMQTAISNDFQGKARYASQAPSDSAAQGGADDRAQRMHGVLGDSRLEGLPSWTDALRTKVSPEVYEDKPGLLVWYPDSRPPRQ